MNKTITERQISLIGRRLNNSKELGEELQQLLKDAVNGEVEVTAEQAQKGFEWLMNLYKSPTGKIRSSNPYGYREQEALDSGLKGFTYDGHHSPTGYGHTPIYTFIGKSGGTFQYYVWGGSINIIG